MYIYNCVFQLLCAIVVIPAFHFDRLKKTPHGRYNIDIKLGLSTNYVHWLYIASGPPDACSLGP